METKKFPINVITLGASGVGKTSELKMGHLKMNTM